VFEFESFPIKFEVGRLFLFNAQDDPCVCMIPKLAVLEVLGNKTFFFELLALFS
jgi:hypothetical protein